ncbi:hypothetical protein GPECTOR_14g226 [Gonium pectorale]|uniref:ABC-type xenobiotic transporter n=1 Tax=Gonium pectorale TaxID=33097 RepID=A0A150GMG5_GONPE|nr:hypothetical protein GPECTOR_14g226 [Gonium pectorale]|eukprot:KXZ50984.1 hypothetical protein GPECTOR_14g226 [Gonium pectorale]
MELLVRPGRPSLLRALTRTHGWTYAWLGLVKLSNDLLGFSGPLLLRLLVAWLAAPPQPPSPEAAGGAGGSGAGGSAAGGAPGFLGALAAALGPSSPHFGLACVAALGGTAAARAFLNAHISYQMSRLACQLRAGFMTVLYRKALLAVSYEDDGGATAAAAIAAATAAAPQSRLAVGGGRQHRRRGRASAPAPKTPPSPPPPAGDEEQGAGGASTSTAGPVVVDAVPSDGGGQGRPNGLAGPHEEAGAGAAAGDHSSGNGSGDGGEGGRGAAVSGEAGGAAGASAGGGGEDVVTLMSVDTSRVVNLLQSGLEFVSMPVQLGVALYLLYTQVRAAFLAGLAVSLLLLPINRLIAGRIGSASVRMMAAKDARVSAMSELLRGIRAVRVAPAWEDFFVAKVASARCAELHSLAVRKYLDALCVYFWAATQLLFSGLTFGLLVAVGGPAALTPPVAFSSLALFGLLTGPLNALPWVINGVVEGVVSVRRLQRYLARAETKALWAYDDLELTLSDLPRSASAAVISAAAAAAAAATAPGSRRRGSGASFAAGITAVAFRCRIRSGLLAALREAVATGGGGDDDSAGSRGAEIRGTAQGGGGNDGGSAGPPVPLPGAVAWPPAVRLVNATFAWGPAARPCLRGVTLDVPRGGLTVLAGRVGSGKSSLLAAMLGGGELPCTAGTCHMYGVRRLSYAPQRPWVTAGSVRDNVLLGAEMDGRLYDQVLSACALLPDLAQLPAGDLTPLGDHGCKWVQLAVPWVVLYRPAGPCVMDRDV